MPAGLEFGIGAISGVIVSLAGLECGIVAIGGVIASLLAWSVGLEPSVV